MKATIIGMGLIGGSLALALRKSGLVNHITAVDTNKQHCAEALQQELADESRELEYALESDLILVCVPVDRVEKLLPYLLDHIGPGTVVMDMGSTKGDICKAVAHHPRRSRFIAAHPIAGTENSGPLFALPDLFQGKTCIICEQEYSDSEALEMASAVTKALEMKVVFMGAADHDLQLAYVSHLSHVISFALARTVLKKEKDYSNLRSLAGSGFASTVRLAKSSPDMWEPIFRKNAPFLLEALDNYIGELMLFREILQDTQTVNRIAYMEEANQIRGMDILKRVATP